MASTLVAVLIVGTVIAAIAQTTIGVSLKPATLWRTSHREGIRARLQRRSASRTRDRAPLAVSPSVAAPPGTRPRHRATIVPVSTPLWRRVRAAFGLTVMVAVLGIAVAATLGFIVVFLASLLDQAVR